MCIVSIVNIALTAVLADDQNFKISIVDEKFSSAKYPPVQPKSGGGGGGRRVALKIKVRRLKNGRSL